MQIQIVNTGIDTVKVNVWRVEYSVEREGFNEMDIDTIDDALHNVKRLWQYCTHD